MKKLSKLILRVFTKAARPYLEAQGLLRTSMVFSRSAFIFEPGKSRVMVLAPHMDDEILGCGGAVALHVSAGATVQVVFLTDGRHGSSELADLHGEQRHRKEMELVSRRKSETQRALDVVGVRDFVFLDAEDGKLSDSPGIVGRLRALVEDFKPDIVYLPFFFEQHADHLAVSKVLLQATQASSLEFQCFGYEVWTPLFPNCLVQIDAVIDLKRRALAEYVSQLADSDYMHSGIALNAFRSASVSGRKSRYAEAFAAMSLGEYRKMFKAYAA